MGEPPGSTAYAAFCCRIIFGASILELSCLWYRGGFETVFLGQGHKSYQRPTVLIIMTAIAPIDSINPARAGRLTRPSLVVFRAAVDMVIPITIDGVASSGPQSGTRANKRDKIPNTKPAMVLIVNQSESGSSSIEFE